MALSEILADLTNAAARDGVAWHVLSRGLAVTVRCKEGDYSLTISREVPSAPSGLEENTVLVALSPLFVGPWRHRTNVPGNHGKQYNTSEVEFTPRVEEA